MVAALAGMSLAQPGAAGLGEAVVSGQAQCSPCWHRAWQPLPSPWIGMLQPLTAPCQHCWDLTAGWEAGRQVACPALSKCCLEQLQATTGLPSLSKDLQGLLGSAGSLVSCFHPERRFLCTSILSGKGSHCWCCSEEGEEHTHPSLPSTCSWMYRVCQCLWDWGAPQSWKILLFPWGNIC